MTPIARFSGKVNSMGIPPEPSFVTLEDHGKTYDTSAITEVLLQNGIDHANCEFEVIVEQDPATERLVGTIRKITRPEEPPAEEPPKEITSTQRWADIDKIGQDAPTSEKTSEERIKDLEQKIVELQMLLQKPPGSS
jgi:hypothetical protein